MDDFLSYAINHNLTIRPIVNLEVSKMMKCKTKALGGSIYECPNCGKTKYVYNTCKSRFCNSCGVKYEKERTNEILSHMVDCTHRHLVFTMPDFLWPLFQKDRKLLNLVFEAVKITLNSWCEEKYKNYKLGFIQTLHTFGRDDKWNVHMHVLIAERLIGKFGGKKLEFFPYTMLRKRWMTVLLKLLEEKLDTSFKQVRNKCYNEYNDGFYATKNKSILDTCRKVVSDVKAAFNKTMTKWRNLALSSFITDPLKCSCGTIMEYAGFVPRLK